MFDFSTITNWIDELLRSCMAPWAVVLVEGLIIGVLLLLLYALIALALIYAERKICAFFQCRYGPNRVGPLGLMQPIADMFKMLIKEIITIKDSDKFLYGLAPFLVIISSMLTFGCMPFGKGLLTLDFNIGVFFIMAVSSIGVLGILLAGWSSNNKFTLIGAMRSGSQMISYELSIGLSILSVVVYAGTMQTSQIIAAQENSWFIFSGHIPMMIAFIIYLIAGTAETNRGPFDLPEAESELTAGYHTEYSGMHFGFYYLAEYLNMFIVSGIASLLFLGGWMPLHIAGWESFNAVMDYIPSILWFFMKTAVIMFIIMWFKWTFPRLRIDQLIKFEWKYLLPIGLFNLLLVTLMVVFGWHF
ncbi:MAG: NADH-quinone oxidoreductase subunit NuoH [Muribaculaceae bacterium]|nr:NADH-quinone oxidoreductase subunit NuoH [Muribaculaceae bacterium]